MKEENWQTERDREGKTWNLEGPASRIRVVLSVRARGWSITVLAERSSCSIWCLQSWENKQKRRKLSTDNSWLLQWRDCERDWRCGWSSEEMKVWACCGDYGGIKKDELSAREGACSSLSEMLSASNQKGLLLSLFVQRLNKQDLTLTQITSSKKKL